jgi:hypothetical protein
MNHGYTTDSSHTPYQKPTIIDPAALENRLGCPGDRGAFLVGERATCGAAYPQNLEIVIAGNISEAVETWAARRWKDKVCPGNTIRVLVWRYGHGRGAKIYKPVTTTTWEMV